VGFVARGKRAFEEEANMAARKTAATSGSMVPDAVLAKNLKEAAAAIPPKPTPAKAKSATKKEEPPKAKVTRQPRGPVYNEKDKIFIRPAGDELYRRTLEGAAPHRALAHMKNGATVADYIKNFSAEIEKLNKAKPGSGDLPGRGGQDPSVQARAILRFLHNEMAVTVGGK
jgi:hypothetical protein